MIDDGKEKGVQNWRIKFLTSGTLTFAKIATAIDVFCVGGGASGSKGSGGGGGGGGYTAMNTSIIIEENVEYPIIIASGATGWNSNSTGATGGTTTAFNLSARGGNGGANGMHTGSSDPAVGNGGAGGSGGGGGTTQSGVTGGNGGSNGSGGDTRWGRDGCVGYGGSGQGTTTREFATSVTNVYIVGSTPLESDWLSLTSGGEVLVPEENIIYSVMTSGSYWYTDYIWNGSKYEETNVAKVYAGGGAGAGAVAGRGGAGGGGNSGASATIANTGGGGGYYGLGSSGIVVIRNHREDAA